MSEEKESRPLSTSKEKPAQMSGKKEVGKENPPKITKKEAKKALEHAQKVAEKPPEQRTPGELLKAVQKAIRAVKAQAEEVAPHLEFLKNVPLPTQEALAAKILELFDPANEQQIKNDPYWLIRRAREFKKIAQETGADWSETVAFCQALAERAVEIAARQPLTGEEFSALVESASKVQQPPEPPPSPPPPGFFKAELFDQEGRLRPELNDLPKEILRVLLAFDELTRRRPEEITYDDYNRVYRQVREGVEKMEQKEGETVEEWRERRAKAWEAAEAFLDKLANEIRKHTKAAPGVKVRFYEKLKDPKFVERFKDPKEHQFRDEQFFEILSEIISSREEPAGRLYGLYERAEMASFIELVRSIPDIGEELSRHYTLLKSAIMHCHDIDYYAIAPQGKVEDFLTSAALFRNEYWTEIHKDPLTETAMRCYYQALMMIRDNNNGFIPAALVEQGELDRLAEELFIQRIKMGQVFDVARKEDGTPFLNRFGKPILDKDKPMSFKDIWDEKENKLNHRARAILQLAKGCNIIQLHFLELIAYSRVPGVDVPAAAIFASKPYEGLARWINWVGDLATKYKWGKHRHLPFFSILAKRKKTRWTQAEARRVAEAAAEGRLEEVFGEGAQRLIDMIDLGGICGWGGPQSKWRILDATHYWDDQMKETLGAGIWLTYAGAWAEGKVRRMLVEEKYRQMFAQKLIQAGELPEDPRRWTAEDKRKFDVKWEEYGFQVYYGKIQEEWKKIKKKKKVTYITPEGEKRQIKIDEEIKKWTQVYKAKAVIQMVMRNPIRAASILELKREEVEGVPAIKRTLRDKIIRKVLGIDLYELSGSYIGKPGTPTQEMLENQAKVAELEGAIAALHEKTIRYVLDEEGRVVIAPANLTREDFESIPVHGKRVRDLRKKALQYWEMVQKEILGEKWSAQDWEGAIFVDPQNRFETKIIGGREERHYRFKKDIDITKLAKEAGASNMLKLIEREWPYLFAPEDISWSLLDIECLGGRHPLRRAGDFAAYIKGVEGLSGFVEKLTGHPNFEALLEQLRVAQEGFSGYDPKQGFKACYLFADAMLKFYDRAWWAQFPGVGDLLKAIIPSSIAKQVYGITTAIDIGPNKKKEIVDQIAQMNIIPPKEEIFGEHFEYNAERLARENGARTINLIWEMVLRGAIGAAFMMALFALRQKEEE